MALFTKPAVDVFAPTDAAGNPRSVLNADAQIHGTEVERLIIALAAGQGGDIDLPNLLITFTITGGTANDIVAVPNAPLPDGPGLALFSIVFTQENTGPVTINSKPLRSNGGVDLVAGAIAPGIYLFADTGDDYRLLADNAAVIASLVSDVQDIIEGIDDIPGIANAPQFVAGTASGDYDGSLTTFPVSHNPQLVFVHLNGVQLRRGVDFSSSGTSAIVLTDAAETGDEVSILALAAASFGAIEFNYEGEYNAGTEYQPGQTVTYNGSGWVALTVTEGNAPPESADTVANTYWGLMVAQGDVGPQGEQGDQGEQGPAGASVYGYQAYASDDSGSDFTLIPDDQLEYQAILVTDTPIAEPGASDFTGLWYRRRGDTGGGNFTYIAYASDDDGADFSLTPGAGLAYFAILPSETEIETPAAGDFAGLWLEYRGPQGDPGVAGADGSAWFEGGTDPSGGTGNDGDFYLQTGTGSTGVLGDIWTKASGTWTKGINIRGPDGNGAVDTVNGIAPSSGDVTLEAENVPYDDSETALGETDVQGALEATNARITAIPDPIAMAIIFGG